MYGVLVGLCACMVYVCTNVYYCMYDNYQKGISILLNLCIIDNIAKHIICLYTQNNGEVIFVFNMYLYCTHTFKNIYVRQNIRHLA